jgi:hypothetical protein
MVVASVTGYRGYQGGLDQASTSYDCGLPGCLDRRSVDGKAARYQGPVRDGRDRRTWSDLVVARADDLAVRVDAVGDRADLVAWQRRVMPATERTLAPDVRVPAGYRLVGHVDADVVEAFNAYVHPDRPEVLNVPTSGHYAGWRAADVDLVAVTLPAGAADLDAIAAWAGRGRWRAATVEVVPGTQHPAIGVAVHESDVCGGCATRRLLVTTSSWGDVVVITSSGTPGPAPFSTLAKVASSLRRS